MTEGSAWTGEGQGQRKDGSQFDVAVTMFPVLDANNQPLSIAAILRDITERKAAEEAVRESRERFQGLVENLSDWIWEVDPNGAYTYVSPKVTDLLGYRPEEMLGKTPFDFMPVDEVQRIAPIFGAVIAAQQPIEALQNTNIHKDGHLVVFETSGTPFYNTQGTFLGYRGTDRDITERKQAEESLRQANLVIESSPVILFRWRADEHWTVELVSDNIQQFGYTPEELLSGATPYATLVYPDDLERVANEVAAFSASGVSSFPQEYRIVTKDGQVRWTDDRTTIIRDADGNITHYEGIVIDSTARKEAETERARLTAVLEFTNVFLEKQSAALIELTRSEAVLEGNIDVALQEITSTAAHTLGVKRSSVWLYDTSRTAIECFDLYEQNTGHSHGIKLSAKDYPGYFEALAQEHVIAANDAHSHPQTQEFSAGYLTPLGINSMLDAPIWLTGRMIGVVCNEHVGPAREWTLEEQAFAISIADFVASAMEAQQRKQAEATILQERNFSTTVINSLPGAFYLFNMKGDMIRWNSNYETVTGYTAEELSTRNALDPIHEEDRPKVAAAITGVFTEGYGDVEARMLRRNGEAIPYYFTGSRLKIGDELYVAGVGIDITERVRAEAAMRESRRMLESVMNSLPESIFWKDKDLVYLGCNTNFAQDAGLDSPEQVIGKTDHDMPWKDQVVLYQADDRHVIETGESKVNYEEPQSTPDGTTIWLRTSKLPLYNEQGEAYAVLGAYADITEQKQAQEQIRIFQSLAENAADGITMVDFEGKITYANRTAYEMLGFDFAQQEMLGMPLASLADEREQGRQAEAIGRIMTEGSAWTGEGQGQRKDGSPFDIAVTMFPVLNANNQPISIAAILRDITERKQAEAEIQKRASELQTVAEVGTAASTILDPDRLLSQVVELTKTNFGLYHAHIYLINETGESLELAAGAGEAGAQMLAQGWKIAADSATSLVARAFRSREGVIANDVRAAPDFLPNPLLPDTRAELAVPLIVGEQVLGVLDVQSDQVDRFTKEDVAIQTTLAGQIATAIENARLFQESRQVDRLKSEFLANMSHELRTPLNSIIGYIQLLLMDLEGEVSEESFEDMQSIDTNSKHLLNLINDILDLAKIEAGRVELHLEEMDVAALLDTVKSNNAGLFIDSPLSFEVSAEEGLPHINADSVRITQILNNLISNAFKFTEAGGVTVRAYREDNDVCIAIQDTGIGIAEKDLDTVFERFRQVDGSFSRRAEGTGLGLSITRLLVDMHKGKLTVRSKFGEGSTFTVHLPASA